MDKRTNCVRNDVDAQPQFDIPPRPAVLERFQAEMASPSPDLLRIEQIVSADVGIAAAVLKLANSPMFYRSRTVTTIRQAVMYLGLATLSTLVIGEVVRRSLTNGTEILEDFWKHSVKVAERVAVLAMHPSLKRFRVTGATAYVYGLLHDCGVAVLLLRVKGYEEQLRKHMRGSSEHEFPVFEQAAFRLTHTDTGGLLARAWGLPEELTQAIRYHHDLTRLQARSATQVSPAALTLICLGALADTEDLRDVPEFQSRIQAVYEHVSNHLHVPEDQLKLAVQESLRFD